MTGGTAGLGEAAARTMGRAPGVRLLLGARREPAGAADVVPLDLASLASVRAFPAAITDLLGDAPIDVLVLNAGVQVPNVDRRTDDGFETNFAVNHLAHYLLLRLLLPKLARGATVVLTTSDTHDPEQVPFGPKTLDLELSAHPKTEGSTGFMDGLKAYASSKLCNLLTARALAQSSDAQAKQLRVLAYNPGLTSGTSLYRDAPFFMRMGVAIGGFFRQANPVELAGSTLAELALGQVEPPDGRIYASLVRRKLTWPDPSELALRDDVARSVWQDSARMVGLPD